MLQRVLNIRFVRFFVTGISHASADFIIYYVLVLLGAYPLLANIAGFSVAVFIAYFLSRHWTFADRKEQHSYQIQFPIFLLNTLVALGLNSLFLMIFYNLLLTLDIQDFFPQSNALIAKFLATGCSMFYNYFVYNKIIFKNHSRAVKNPTSRENNVS